MSSSSSIDYLFEDEPRPLLSLPAEIRNNIYDHVFPTEYATVQINESGHILLPALSQASRQVQAETIGYAKSALARPDTLFQAQVRDYDAKPLLATLHRVADSTGVEFNELIRRTQVSFLGNVNIDNLLSWVEASFADPDGVRFFYYDFPSFGGYTGAELCFWGGRIALPTVIWDLELCTALGRERAWRCMGLRFLWEMEDFGAGVVPRLGDECGVAEVKMAVFKTFAIWHHTFMRERGKAEKKGRPLLGGKRKRDRGELQFGAAELMDEFLRETAEYLVEAIQK